MIYLIDPATVKHPKCFPNFCITLCNSKPRPLYGIDPDDM